MARAQERVRPRVRNREEPEERQPTSGRERRRQVRTNLTVADVRRGAQTQRKVGKEVVHNAETDHEDERLTREVPAVHAKVGVSGSSTVRVREFESVQVRCWIELPCAPDPRSVEAAYREASDYVENWIQRELDAAVPEG